MSFLPWYHAFIIFLSLGVSSDKSEALGIFDRMCWITFNPNWYSTLLLRMIQDHLKRSRKEIFPTISRRPSRTFFALAFLLGLYGSVAISVRFLQKPGLVWREWRWWNMMEGIHDDWWLIDDWWLMMTTTMMMMIIIVAQSTQSSKIHPQITPKKCRSGFQIFWLFFWYWIPNIHANLTFPTFSHLGTSSSMTSAEPAFGMSGASRTSFFSAVQPTKSGWQQLKLILCIYIVYNIFLSITTNKQTLRIIV